MLERILKSIKDKIAEDDFLLKNINSYHLLEKSSSAAYPSIIIKNFSYQINDVMSDSSFINNMKFFISLELDHEGQEFIELIDEKLKESLNRIIVLDSENKLEMLLSLESIDFSKKKNITEIIYKFFCRIFYKTQFFN